MRASAATGWSVSCRVGLPSPTGVLRLCHGALQQPVKPVKLSPQAPNLNAFAERWVHSVKEECLDQLILFGERSLRHALHEYLAHHQHERNHQGLDNVIPFPDERAEPDSGKIVKSERLGGLLNFYYRQAA